MKILFKKVIMLVAIVFCFGALNAQVSVQLNFGSPPAWGPSGYTEVRYYYLPDIEAYYDVQDQVFIYYQGGGWVRYRSLPPAYAGYDLYGGPKIVINGYYGARPYSYYHTHRSRFPKGYHGGVHMYKQGPSRGYHQGGGQGKSYKQGQPRPSMGNEGPRGGKSPAPKPQGGGKSHGGGGHGRPPR